jgi:hypothetical protein
MVDIEGILEEVVVKVIGHASRKNAFWLISMDRDCMLPPDAIHKPRAPIMPNNFQTKDGFFLIPNAAA